MEVGVPFNGRTLQAGVAAHFADNLEAHNVSSQIQNFSSGSICHICHLQVCAVPVPVLLLYFIRIAIMARDVHVSIFIVTGHFVFLCVSFLFYNTNVSRYFCTGIKKFFINFPPFFYSCFKVKQRFVSLLNQDCQGRPFFTSIQPLNFLNL